MGFSDKMAIDCLQTFHFHKKQQNAARQAPAAFSVAGGKNPALGCGNSRERTQDGILAVKHEHDKQYQATS